ncbi:MAG: hypothetical protein GY797_03345 [Deltaproteobacteria bacterium]|nr:hypothetical protein [Deltaproteobacteria bacterium]
MKTIRNVLTCFVCFFSLTSLGIAKTSGPLRDKVDSIIIHATGGPICKNGKVEFTPSGTITSMKNFVSSNCFQREINTSKFHAAFLSVSTDENSFNNNGFPVLI